MNGKSGNEQVKEYNPIIAFVGERGSGKTSALESFRLALEKGHPHNNKTIWPDKEILEKCKFDVLPTIDPTALSEHESLLNVIAAHMYRQVERFQDERRSNHTDDNLDSVLRNAALQLKELYDALRALNQERSEQYAEFAGYERLGQLSISYNLYEQFKKAVHAYLKLTALIYENSVLSAEHRFLVIPIDDLDMNAKDGYKLCEELRRYMMVPSIVVLMSAKIDQLQSVIAQELAKQLTNETGESGSMAERYLAKLIPINRRHALPVLTVYNMVDYDLVPEEGSKLPLVDTFLKLLYDRLGLILIKNSFGSHVILPRTIRGIVHLYYLLFKMPPVFDRCPTTPLTYDDGRIQNIDNLSHNIDAFWDHFLSNGIEESTGSHIPAVLLKQMRAEHWSSVNRLVAKAIKRIMDSEKLIPKEPSHADSIADICSVETIDENVSLGDALYMLERLEIWGATPQWRRFAASVRVAYSLLLIHMFFIDRRPDYMRKFIVQLNNPDTQKLIPTNALSQTRRDWNPQVEWKNIHRINAENDTSLVDYYANMKDKMKVDDASILNNNIALKWLILNIVWLGLPDSEKTLGIYWRSIWHKPYLDTIESRNTSNIKYIAINYIAFATNLLSPSSLWNLEGETDDEESKKYTMVFPLYSADVIQYVVSHSEDESARKNTLKDGEFAYIEYFIEGIDSSIAKLNKRIGDGLKRPYTIAIEPLDSPIMAGYKEVSQIQIQTSLPELTERLEPMNRAIERMRTILKELEPDETEKTRKRKAKTIVNYCDEIIGMFSVVNMLEPSRREIQNIKQQNKELSARSNSARGTQERLIHVLKNYIPRNTPVSNNG